VVADVKGAPVVLRKRGETFESRVRGGHVVGLNHKRLLTKRKLYEAGTDLEAARKGQRMCAGGRKMFKHEEMLCHKLDVKVEWLYDGHSGESDEKKEKKKKEREILGLDARYPRGLRVLQDGTNTKLFDRDLSSSNLNGYLYICDRVKGHTRPLANE
jgi:hypothetical protein